MSQYKAIPHAASRGAGSQTNGTPAASDPAVVQSSMTDPETATSTPPSNTLLWMDTQ